MPDNGKLFPVQRMRENGFTLYQDFKHKDGHETRWWFRNLEAWHKKTPGIESLGYTATHHLKVV